MTRYIFLFCIVLGCFSACQNGQKESAKDQVEPVKEATEKQDKEAKIFVSVIGGLRVRDEPNANGKVLGKLAYGQEVIDLEEESDVKERIELREKMRYDSWRKIKMNEGSKEEIEGWTFGGGLLNYSAIYRETSLDTIERMIVGATKDELSAILNLKVSTGLFYDGIVRYSKSISGELIRDGSFEVKGMQIEEIDGYPYEKRSAIIGNYKSGNKHGLFEKRESVYESGEEILINFENDKCTWTSTTLSSEGEGETTRDDNPSVCGF